MTTTTVNGTSTIKRNRRTRAEVEELETAIYDVVEIEQPCTIRGVFYRVMSQGLVPKTENGYRQVQNRVLPMRRAGSIPYGWISDGTRWRIKPTTWTSVDRALQNTAISYRRALWDDQDVYVEIWSEKDAIRSVVAPVTAEFDVPLMVARGYPSQSFLYDTGQTIVSIGKPAVIYQLGDHDPSGVDAWDHTRRRLVEFAPTVDFTLSASRLLPPRSSSTRYRRGQRNNPIHDRHALKGTRWRLTRCRPPCCGISSGAPSSGGSIRTHCG